MAAELDAAGTAWAHPRAGKRVATWKQTVDVPGVHRPVRRVLRLVERTIGSRGQHLILPEYELDGWTTSLPARIDASQVMALYADHGMHEQFHAEFGANDRAAAVFLRLHARIAGVTAQAKQKAALWQCKGQLGRPDHAQWLSIRRPQPSRWNPCRPAGNEVKDSGNCLPPDPKAPQPRTDLHTGRI